MLKDNIHNIYHFHCLQKIHRIKKSLTKIDHSWKKNIFKSTNFAYIWLRLPIMNKVYRFLSCNVLKKNSWNVQPEAWGDILNSNKGLKNAVGSQLLSTQISVWDYSHKRITQRYSHTNTHNNKFLFMSKMLANMKNIFASSSTGTVLTAACVHWIPCFFSGFSDYCHFSETN